MFFPGLRPARLRGKGLICAIAIDAEEDFDWAAPVPGTPYTTECMHHIRDLQSILSAWGIAPTYLLTYPVLEDVEAVRILRRYLERGECDAGVQLHPWVTPPFGEGVAMGATASYSGNLGATLEALKLAALTRKFTDRLGRAPRIYRAGRYGLSEHTATALEEHGFEIDTSLAPRTDFSPEGGPDYSAYSYGPFWFGRQGRILELPLCRDIVGWGGPLATPLYRALTLPAAQPFRLPALLTRSRFAERITLSPEGNDVGAMRRLVRGLGTSGAHVLVLSFHSSSLVVGRSPYVRNRAELHGFYDRLSAILEHLAGIHAMRFARLAEIPALMEPPG